MFDRLGRFSPKIHCLLLIVGCALCYGLWFVRVPLTEIDEVRYSEATREMLASRDFIIPHFNYAPRFQKPILYYWIQATSVKILGTNELAARLPSALAAILMVLFVYSFLLHWLPRRAGDDPATQRRARAAAFLGAAALATMPAMVVWARAAVTDIPLTLFITGAVLALMQADLVTATDGPNAARSARNWYLVAAIAAGLAFLTKGPIGLAIPGVAWLLYHLLQLNVRAEARRIPWIPALTLFLLVAAPWFIATYFRVGTQFLTHFFVAENIQRYSGKTMEGHGSTNLLMRLIIYLPIALLLASPYSAFLARDLAAPFSGNSRMTGDAVLGRLRRFAWVWLFVVIAIFSFSATQLPSYILSIVAPAAVLFALHAAGLLAPNGLEVKSRLGAGITLTLLALLGIIFTAGPFYALSVGHMKGPLGWSEFPYRSMVLSEVLVLAVGILFFIGIINWFFTRNTRRLLGWTMACWLPMLAMIIVCGVQCIVSAYSQSATAGRFLRGQPNNESVVAYCPNVSEDLVYYSRRQVNFVPMDTPKAPQKIAQLLTGKPSLLVVTTDAGLRSLDAVTDTQILLHLHEDFLVARVRQKGEPAGAVPDRASPTSQNSPNHITPPTAQAPGSKAIARRLSATGAHR